MSARPIAGRRTGRAWALAYGTLALLALAPAMTCASSARADVFGSISLLSVGSVAGGRAQQAEYAHDAAISGDGHYVVFDGAVGGVTGVWRRNVATGAFQLVAGGDATLPSISQNGRYVSFTTTANLVPEDGARGPNVWVRDMEPAAGEPEFELVSAVSGSSQALGWVYANPGVEEAKLGAVAAGRTAISADGREVAFVTTAVSNLAGPQTPAMQVAVRYLNEQRTVLVSGSFDPGTGQTTEAPVSEREGEGAVYAGTPTEVGFRATPPNASWESSPPPGASISADGSTVAWMGANIVEQARMLPSEAPPALYTEPLWRRIAPGSQTPTERVTGGSDPGNPACVASGEAVLPARESQSAGDPCQGPFAAETSSNGGQSVGIWTEQNSGEADYTPRLSANGETVAFVGSAQPIGFGLGFSGEFGQPADLYLASMRPGLTRDQALTPLTKVGGANVAADAPITDYEIASNGTQIAFTTRRTQFALGSPAFVSAPASEPGESELFEIDLGDDTLTRATQGYEGGPSEQTHGSLLQCEEDEDPYCKPITIGAQSPSLTSDGRLIAFSSTASNLVFGDGNSSREPSGHPEGAFDGSDAFLIERRIFTAQPTPQQISPAPVVAPTPEWRLGLTVLSHKDGSVVLYAQVPGAGSLHAAASGAVVVGPVRKATPKHAKRSAAGHARPSRSVVTRTVATRSASSKAAGLQTLTLALAPRYRSLAGARGGYSATLAVTFSAAHHPTLRQRIAVTFLRKSKKQKKRPRAHGSGRTATGGRR